MLLSPENIEEAGRVVDPTFLRTPQFVSAELSRRLGRDTAVKVETLNPIGSFKGRGADWFMRGVEPGRQVVCASAGNFGQGIAYAARARGIAVTVFASTAANAAKLARMRELEAEVVLVGDDFDEAKDAARVYAAGHDCLFVEDGDDPRIAEGAGTIAVELAAMMAAATVDTLLVPVGNGALISGVGCWLKASAFRTRIVGVCAAEAPAMALSWRDGRPVTTRSAATVADGIAVRVPVPAAVEWMRSYVDDVLLVSEDAIGAALRVVRDTLGLLVEPSGAVGVAAAMEHPGDGPVATIVTGGNLSADLLAELTGRASTRTEFP
jgi:threonine dehydratase